jgi:hypothetical protein
MSKDAQLARAVSLAVEGAPLAAIQVLQYHAVIA